MQENNTPDYTKLSPEELDQQLETVIRFLCLVHPSLVSDETHKSCVELRPIVRGDKNYILAKPCNIWDLSSENTARVKAFLKKHNGAPTCLFYSVFTYDNNMKTLNSAGKLVKPGHISSASAVDTSEIALDFDHIGFEEYTELVDRFEELGLYALWTSTGHGYHAHLLLQDALADKEILRRLVYKFRSKGFECDSVCVDPARVMRLPGTFNKKFLVDKDYEAERTAPRQCSIVQESHERYTVDAILTALDKLPTVSPDDEEVYLSNTSKAVSGKSTQTTEGSVELDIATDILRRIEYPYLSEYDLPDAIKRILAHTPKGFRNQCLGYLIRFMKGHFHLSKTQILDILTLWSKEGCSPAYDPKEFKRDFARLYYDYNGLSYTSEMARQFGHLDADELIQLRKKDIVVPNKLFRAMSELDGTAVRVYLALKMMEHTRTTATQASLADLLGISTRALRPAIQALEKSGFAYRVSGNRKLGIPFSYRTSHLVSRSDGYMTFSYNDIKAYVTELHEEGNRANGALKLFLFFRWKFFSGDIYMSQSNLGEHIGVHQTTISQMVAKLESLHFIRVRKVRKAMAFMESCEYTLLR